MSGEKTGNDPALPKNPVNLADDFDKSRRQQQENDDFLALAAKPPVGNNETSIGTDFQNFFKVLFTFLSGLWNRDMADFDLLSSVYFPSESEDKKEPEENKNLRARVARMRTMRDDVIRNPETVFTDPQIRSLSEGLPEDELRKNPRKIILDMISSVESNGNYNIAYGNKSVNLTDMSIAEVLQWQKEQKTAGAVSTAVGRYQFLNGTLQELVETHHIDPDTKFDQATQDKLANHLLDRRGFNDYMAGNLPVTTFMKQLSMEWAALPKDASNKSYYANDGINKSLINSEQFEATLLAAKQAGSEITAREKIEIASGDLNRPSTTPLAKIGNPAG